MEENNDKYTIWSEEEWNNATTEERINRTCECIDSDIENACSFKSFFKKLNDLIKECENEYDNMIPIERLEELIKEL